MNKEEILKELYPEDFYGYSNELTENEVKVLYQLRQTINEHLRPVISKAWDKGEFPTEAFEEIKKIGLMNDPGLFENIENTRLPRQLYLAFRSYELGRFDGSIATFFGVHAGLCYHTILMGGSKEQIDYYAPKLASFELQGCFALTEPQHGSDISGGLETSARREGNKWIINGEKRWIGGAGTADIIPVFARDTEDKQVKCFIVTKNSNGFKAEAIKEKTAFRSIDNYHITLTDVEVSEDYRLSNINSFKDVGRILTATRADVAYVSAGMSAGSLEAALKYTKQREQFGKPISQFQLIQEKLATMQANVISQLNFAVQLAKMQSAGNYDDVNASIAKMYNAKSLRETVALGREIVGGNGITLERDVGRFFTDAEAIYSFEGTHEINALIVGRKLSGKQAFV